eukprot:TRINITY_DN39921_c0_g1_i18.p1 TRINITY_DN39921_c0_g1~~TRINITY_DN39921_c0_g1_i18.p1  ORF type:complete len:291 (-),score=25.65 TRINITY_DN39921_c0_g1_i18:34-906(-)
MRIKQIMLLVPSKLQLNEDQTEVMLLVPSKLQLNEDQTEVMLLVPSKLQLNEDQTEIMLLVPSKLQNHPSLPSSICINGTDISFTPLVRNLGVMFDSTLSFKQQVSNVCKAAYIQLRNISLIRHYLSVDATKTLVCSLVLSRLDYCNSLLAGAPKYLIERMQKVQNHAARLIFKSSRRDHITPLLHDLHWLPIQSRISYKLSSICFSSATGTGPEYLSDILNIYAPPRQLRSSADNRMFCIPTVRTKSIGERSLVFQGPTIWNNLPQNIRYSVSKDSFKSALKTHLFVSQ